MFCPKKFFKKIKAEKVSVVELLSWSLSNRSENEISERK